MVWSVDEAIASVDAVKRMPRGEAKSAAALAQVRRIDAEGPETVLPYALTTLVEAYNLGGEIEKSYVPFSRALALYDAHAERFTNYDRYMLFSMFKWMIFELKSFPAVSTRQLLATLDDMQHRYAVEGYGPDAVCEARWDLAWHRGDADVWERFDEWMRQTQDDMSDCELCAMGNRVKFLLENGRVDEGLQLLEEAQADPEMRRECTGEPVSILAIAQFSYLYRGNEGDLALAAQAHRHCRSYLIGTSGVDPVRVGGLQQNRAGAYGCCVEFLACTRNVEDAIRMLEDCQTLLTTARTPLQRLTFLQGVGAGLHVLVDELGLGERPVRVREPAVGTLGRLWVWGREQGEQLASAFDRRNGTPHRMQELHHAWSVAAQPQRLDLRIPVPAAVLEPVAHVDGVVTPIAADATHPDPDALLREAEAAVECDRSEAAVATYLAAARGMEERGALGDAGFALAEAGHLAQLLDDVETARVCLHRAWQVLVAAGTPSVFRVPVTVELARCLARAGRYVEEAELLDTETVALDRELKDVPDPDLAEDVAESRLDDLRWARLQIDEARVPGLIRDGSVDVAARMAESAAEGYAELGLASDAAGAFEVAGYAWEGIDDEQATWCLESAVEGYQLAEMEDARVDVANQLIDLLHRMGRDADADAVVANL